METNVINTDKFKEKRPRRKYQYSDNFINNQINVETKLAFHSLRLYCIKNLLWLVPLLAFVFIAFLIDIVVVLFVWQNPSILFGQLKTAFSWILAYVLGLYTDDLRKKFTKN